MPGKGLLFLVALSMVAPASSFAADLPMRSAPAWRHHYGHIGGGDERLGVAYGLVPGLGQLGAAAFGYYGVAHCWTHQPAYDADGDYFGVRPVDVCVN
jgi:hypothetical protein